MKAKKKNKEAEMIATIGIIILILLIGFVAFKGWLEYLKIIDV